MYADVVILWIANKDSVELFLFSLKSHIGILKCVTIPRIELLAALIHARLVKSVADALGLDNTEKGFLSDTTTVLTLISREKSCSVFFKLIKEVQEIRNLGIPSLWKYISVQINSANLPSREYIAKELVSLKEWEDPLFLEILDNIINMYIPHVKT